MNVEDIAS